MKSWIGFAMALCFSGISLWGAVPAMPARAADIGTTYYVDSSAGSDANNGTSPDAPWQTLSKVNAETFSPGDQILFKADDSWTGTLEPQGTGNSGAQIVVGMYGNGAKPHIEGNGALAAVILQNAEYWTISDLDVSNTASTTTAKRDGILVEAKVSGITHNIHITGCEIHNVDGDYRRNYYMYSNAAILVTYPGTSSAENRFDGVYIENNYVHDITNCGIKVTTDTDSAQDIHFTNVVIQNNIISKTGTDGAIISHCIDPLIQNNQCLDAGYNGTVADTQLIAGLWEDNCLGAVFQYNEIARTRFFRGDGEALDTDWGSGGTIIDQYNYTHDNQGGFFLNCSGLSTDPSYIKTVLRYNVSVNDSMRIITPSNGLETDIYNNDFYKSSGNLDPSSNSSYYYWNNIFDFQTSPSWGSNTYSNNCYFPVSSIPADSSAIAANPLFVNAGADGDGMSFADNYKLKPVSPCINAGMGIAQNGGLDFWGDSLYSGAPDIGAEECNGNGDSPSILQSITAPSAVTGVAHGSAKTASGLGLPEEVYLVTNAATMQADVTWDVAGCSYDPSDSDGQTFTVNGTISLPNGVTNPNAISLSVSISVTVNPLVVNAGFESGALSPWISTRGSGASVVSGNAHSGSYAAFLTGNSVGVDQIVSGLQPNTVYTLSAWAKVSTSGDNVGIGVKNYGGTSGGLSVGVQSTNYTQANVPFTTGPTNTTAYIYAWKNAGTSNTYVDDFSISPEPANAGGNLQSIVAPSAIAGLSCGTANTASALSLPSQVDITTDSGSFQANVAWDTADDGYFPANSSGQTFTVSGTVSLPNGITNANNVPLSTGIQVSVGAAVVNAGFESGTLSPWSSTTGSGVSVASNNAYDGNCAALLTGSSVGINQTISGLQPNTAYLLTAYAKVSSAGDDIGIGVQNFGGTETWGDIVSTSYSQVRVPFTTGASNTTANIYAWKNKGAGNTYLDDFAVTAQPVLTGITAPAAITGLPSGTANTTDALGLPAQADLVTNTNVTQVPITWDVAGDGYLPASGEAQNFTVTGTAALPDGILNPNGIPLTVTVSVSVDAALPDAPAGLAATPGNGQVALSWTACSNSASYNVYESTASGSYGATPAVSSVTGLSVVITGLHNGTTYYFEVRAVNSAGESASSSEISAIPAAEDGGTTGGSSSGGPVSITGTQESDGSYGAGIPSSDLGSSVSNITVRLGNISITAPSMVLSSALGGDASLTLTQGASPSATQQAAFTLATANNDVPVAALDFHLNTVAADGVTTAVHTLSGPVAVTVTLTAAQIATLGGTTPDVYYYDMDTNPATLVDLHAVFDSTTGTLTFATDHFSTYIVAASGADSFTPGVSYAAHVQSIGWQKAVTDGAEAGTEHRSLRAEAIRIQLTGTLPKGAGIEYQAHVQHEDWLASVTDGAVGGTTGKRLRLEALRITLKGLTGYAVKYRAYVQHYGWLDWVTTANGTEISKAAVAGTTGKGLRIEALEIQIVKIP